MHNKYINVEYLQDEGWQYNLIVYLKDNYESLTEGHGQKNLDVELPDGRSFRKLLAGRYKKFLAKPSPPLRIIPANQLELRM